MYCFRILFILPLFSSCLGGERATSNNFYLSNKSGTTIKIAPSLTLSDTLTLKNNQFLEFHFGFERGITQGIETTFSQTVFL